MLPWCEGTRYTRGVYPVTLEWVHRHGDWGTLQSQVNALLFWGFCARSWGECQLVQRGEAGLSVLG